MIALILLLALCVVIAGPIHGVELWALVVVALFVVLGVLRAARGLRW